MGQIQDKPRMMSEELIEEDKPRMTAEELIEFYDRHYGKDKVFQEIFGVEYEFEELIVKFGSRGVVDMICKWKEGQEGE